MDTRQLLSCVAFSTLLLVVPAPALAADGCSKEQVLSGTCTASSVINPNLSAVELVGESTSSTEPTSPNSVEPDEGPSLESPAPPTPPPPANCSPADATLCAVDPTAPSEEPAPEVVVTLRDIASFRPATPGNGMEPGGWAVVGLPANFVAAASVEVVSGTLLGQPADVRFTPVGYRWSHSDAAVVESGMPGATWVALGQREFSPTATSHVYAAPGEYTVALVVILRAEYRFAGSPWRSIAGTLSVSGTPQRVLVGEFDTVLTNGDCVVNPSSPGC